MFFKSTLIFFLLFSIIFHLYLGIILKIRDFAFSLFEKSVILVALKENLSNEEIIELQDKIAQIPFISKLIYLSPKEAYDELKDKISFFKKELLFNLPPYFSFPPMLEIKLRDSSIFPSFSKFDEVVAKIGILGENNIDYIQYPRSSLESLERLKDIIIILFSFSAILLFLGYLILMYFLASHLSLTLIKRKERLLYLGAILEASIIILLNFFFFKLLVKFNEGLDFVSLELIWIILIFTLIIFGEVTTRHFAKKIKKNHINFMFL